MDTSAQLLFVYGTLKRGGSNHRQLAGEIFIGEARTVAGYRLFALEGYPGMVPLAEDREGVVGEVWSVKPDALARLDRFEGVDEGLYRREPVPLLPPFATRVVHTYFYARTVAGRTDLGSVWTG
jgi:gamma-glutamylcyclotransferase (GGCT)/AIG2-like uncharacterized protein YtfP